MIFVYGQTRLPRKTTDIYLPLAREVKPICRGECEPIRIPVDAPWRDRLERRYLKPMGHRNGPKGATLRNHREG